MSLELNFAYTILPLVAKFLKVQKKDFKGFASLKAFKMLFPLLAGRIVPIYAPVGCSLKWLLAHTKGFTFLKHIFS